MGRRHGLKVKYQNSKSRQLDVSTSTTATVLPISLPLELCNVDTLPALQAQLEHLSLPAQWFSSPVSESIHQLFKINASAAQVSLSVQINSQLNWTAVTVAGNNISADFFSQSEFDADTKLVSSQQALHLLSYLDKCQLCIGNTDEKFLCLNKNDTTPGTYNFSLKH